MTGDTITLDFPIPPSLNRLWRSGKNRKTGKIIVYKSSIYNTWLKQFWIAWFENKPQGFRTIDGPFDAEILVAPSHKRDADNSAKATLDAAQRIGIIHNDSQARRVIQEVVTPDRAPLGARLIIRPL